MIRPFGEHALLADVDSLGEVLDLHRSLRATRPSGVVDLVPAARTVLVRVDPRALSLAAARAWVEGADAAPLAAEVAAAETVDVPIVYDGEDLRDVASALAVSVDALVAQHSGASWTVAFTGFAPGFGYLVSDDWPYDVPRLESPRTRVPAGSVGLAGEFSGAYPRDTPGGWQLIGTTTATLFDPAAARSSLLRPGDLVRFRPARASVATGDPAARLGEVEGRSSGGQARHEEQRSLADASPDAALTVLAAGPLTTVQDLGRPGHLAEGVAISGAADRGSLRIANRLVGNDEGAAALEITLGGFRATAHRDLWIAVTGAWGPLRIAGRAVDPFRAHLWPAGTDLEVR
ncbi:carboxyltransferase domain-containing protein, partial [Microbacterium sp.]|uniref:5-oxoprolinase subunit B/C family protein n=1 Tax=Microbacterium sp. TaxID=51671 RepID=UPI003735A66E